MSSARLSASIATTFAALALLAACTSDASPSADIDAAVRDCGDHVCAMDEACQCGGCCPIGALCAACPDGGTDDGPSEGGDP